MEQDVPSLLGAVAGAADDHNLPVARDLGKTRCKLVELKADVKLLPVRLEVTTTMAGMTFLVTAGHGTSELLEGSEGAIQVLEYFKEQLHPGRLE
jgi:hypothetical protein